MGKPVSKQEFYKQLDEEQTDYKAEKELHNMGERPSVTEHDHLFTHGSGNTANCTCGWGVYLDLSDELRDGHLFRNGSLII